MKFLALLNFLGFLPLPVMLQQRIDIVLDVVDADIAGLLGEFLDLPQAQARDAEQFGILVALEPFCPVFFETGARAQILTIGVDPGAQFPPVADKRLVGDLDRAVLRRPRR